MLANGRQEMVARAVASFRAQAYREKTLLIYDTGSTAQPSEPDGPFAPQMHYWYPEQAGLRIGALRNAANALTTADIIVHWDSDDWSAPARLTEQVALLQSSGKDCVGYFDMLFWRYRVFPCQTCGATEYRSALNVCTEPGAAKCAIRAGEAWIHTSGFPGSMLGSSLCYWRRAWERAPFDPRYPTHPLASGEDWGWYKNQERVAVSSLWQCPDCGGGRGNILPYCPGCGLRYDPSRAVPVIEPRMICSIHAGNSSGAYADDVGRKSEWRRAPEWDEYCSRIMRL